MKVHAMRLIKRGTYLGLTCATILCGIASVGRSELIIEPVINRFVGNDDGIPLGDFMPLPGDIFSYVSGDPRDPALDTVPIVNTTNYELNGYGLRIIGIGTDTHDPGTIVRGPIDARFGDVDGDGMILSDIFATFAISGDGKTIEFSDGSISPGERFTGIHLAVSDNPPILAGIDSWYTGTLVPEPSSATLLVLWGLPLLGRRRARH